MKISVIIAAYNAAGHIGGCLKSLLNQDRPAHEIIVVNDGSTDTTAQIVRDFDVTLLHYESNRGAGAARAHGANRATGDILAFLDADCMAPPNWLKTIAAAFTQEPSLGGIGGCYKHSTPASLTGLMAKVEEEYAHHIFSLYPDQANPPGGNSAFTKKAWGLGRSGLEIYLFRGMASGEDNLVANDIRRQFKIKFTNTLKVDHQPLPAKGYFRRHFYRGFSKALAQSKGLNTAQDLSFAAYGGLPLLAGSAALAGACLCLILLPWRPLLSAAGAMAMLAAHLLSTRRFFDFVQQEGKASFSATILIRFLLVLRAFCWAAGAAYLILKTVFQRLKTAWNVLCSVIHFWRPGRISKLFYFVTSVCNARCEFCFNLDNVINWKSRKSVELTIEEVKKIAANFGRLPYLTLSGGEPFMRRDLPELIETFHKICKTQWVTIPSNASLTKLTLQTTQEILSRCPGLFLTIQVSLDSMREEHDRSRKIAGGFQALTNTLKGLAPLKKHYTHLRIQIATCFDDFNLDRIQEMKDFCRKNFDYDQQMFYLIRDDGALITRRKNHLIAPFLETLGENESYEHSRHRRTLWSRAVRALNGIVYADIVAIKKEGRFLRACHATQKFVTLYDNGQISPCEVLETANLGNIRDFDYNFYKLIRRRQAKDFYNKEILEKKCNCDWNCATPINMLYDPKTFPRIAKAMIKPDKATVC